ncbi:hypothetical protein ACIO6T_43780 [Streptomyces sp. NPDC087532]|uniref:hypothetical protein n=1 Tax=unclassified Streptomyces TaxID=2593676 RepID=UPI00331B2230
MSTDLGRVVLASTRRSAPAVGRGAALVRPVVTGGWSPAGGLRLVGRDVVAVAAGGVAVLTLALLF